MTRFDRAPGKYLDSLAFRCTPELVGDATVHVRHLDTETAKLWNDFDNQCKQRYGNDSAQAPYSIATLVLSVISGGYVHFDPDRRHPFLASRQALNPKLLRRAFTLTHGLALGADADSIDLTQPPELADRIADTTEASHQLADHLEPIAGEQPRVPNWVYRTVTWDLAERLAAQRWAISDNRKITLRPDTTGGLVALDQPWANDQGGRFALSRTDLQLITMPHLVNPLLIATSRVTRISDSLIFCRTALADRGPGSPVLEVSLNGRGGARTVNHLALQALSRLEMDRSILDAMATRSMQEQALRAKAKEEDKRVQFPRQHPDRIWPILPKNKQFPIGVGVGMHHMRMLREHFIEVFGDAAQQPEMVEVGSPMPHRPNDAERISTHEYQRRKEERDRGDYEGPLRPKGALLPNPEDVLAAVEAAGFSGLRIACLWYRDEARLRMLNMLVKAFGIDTAALDPANASVLDLYRGHITATFHYAPNLLEPGPVNGRTAALETSGIPLAAADGDTLVGAWCETEYPSAGQNSEGSNAIAVLDDIDAKHQTRRLFGERDIANQYLLGVDSDGNIITPKADDHPAMLALLDLYRSLGIVDQRFANALPETTIDYPIDQIAHVGFHIRQQNRRPGEYGQPKVIITAAAFVPPTAAGGVWTMLGWSSTRPEWQPYRLAQTAFHATGYPQLHGEKKTYRQRWDDAATQIECALGDLTEELSGAPYVVTIDEQASRRMWDGLHNAHQGTNPEYGDTRYRHPGASLPHDERPDAVIRINIDRERVVPATGTTQVFKEPGKEPKTSRTTRKLYQVTTDFGTPVWVLCNVPLAFDGQSGGRFGEHYTRWDAARSVYSDNPKERRKSEMPQNWYSMTTTEIYPMFAAPRVDAQALAITTANLCHQTMAWTDRSRYPAPLHAAKKMDEDHPQYRRSAAPGDSEDVEPGDD
ncbi:RNaseH domain-containing protein [Nocardia brevicatena]|uniref:RNaseH domain-containing protein n=1 Tax=Nocardia brevicatena TaxID=37327 RepID=UPI0002E025CF|nr:RNaseH domain-containing protein [Nocardia brevicatena]